MEESREETSSSIHGGGHVKRERERERERVACDVRGRGEVWTES